MKIHKKHKTPRIKKVGFGTSDIALMCRVTPATVANWIDGGKIAAYLTAGGHRRVSENNLVAFMRKLSIPLPENLEAKNSPHVLIVDDDEVDRRQMVGFVRKSFPRAKVLEAENGFDMGHKTATFRPVLMILDLKLPGIDGFEVCEAIRKDPKLKEMKILAVSGQDDEATRNRILKKGADDFLSKNSDVSEWGKTLEALLTKWRVVSNGAN